MPDLKTRREARELARQDAEATDPDEWGLLAPIVMIEMED